MADPKKGYLSGVDRIVLGSVSSGKFTPADEPAEGFNPGVLQVTIVSIDADGNPDTETDDAGIRRTVTGTVASGVYSSNDQPEEGLNSGVYRATEDTEIPEEGFIPGHAGIVTGAVSSGIWSELSSVFSVSFATSFAPEVFINSSYTFARADGNGTYVDADGQVNTAAIDEERVEPDGGLFEPEQTNIQTNTTDFGAWTIPTAALDGANSRVESEADPMGGTLGGVLSDESDSSAVNNYDDLTVSAGDSTWTIFVKEGTAALTEFRTRDKDAGNNTDYQLTWSGGVPSIVLSAGTGTAGVFPTAYKNGYYRIWMTRSFSATDARFTIFPASTSNPTAEGTIGVFGSNVVVSSQATSYIPTAATRAGDLLKYSSLNIPGEEFTIVADINLPQAGGLTDVRQQVAYIRNISTTNHIRMSILQTTGYASVSRTGSGVYTENGLAQIAAGAHSIALAHSLTGANCLGYFDGNRINVSPADSDDSTALSVDEFTVGARQDTIQQLNGNISNLRVYDGLLTEGQLASLTT